MFPNSPSPSLVPSSFVTGYSSIDCGNHTFSRQVRSADRLPCGRDFNTHQVANLLNLPSVFHPCNLFFAWCLQRIYSLSSPERSSSSCREELSGG
nr:GDSL esterase/lipase At5g08460-like [Ipomoea batatas]